jgi:hypothetical protein
MSKCQFANRERRLLSRDDRVLHLGPMDVPRNTTPKLDVERVYLKHLYANFLTPHECRYTMRNSVFWNEIVEIASGGKLA